MKSLIIAAALVASPIMAQGANNGSPAMMCADGGTMMVTRVSKLTPTGTRAGYAAAVKGHQAWYAKVGLKNVIISSPVFNSDGGVSDNEFASIHLFERKVIPRETILKNWPDADKAWSAYVKLYRDNSVIVNEAHSCLPKNASLAVN